MVNTTPTCACEPCGCTVSPQTAVEKDGKLFCSQPCADGHAGGEQCCTSCECC
ncbi:MAG: metallothionein [Cyanobium sp. ARS6]|uniref:metallothionein n=1 Tax=unclassified Synechococcus TaxID=2626047 RepID=UPI000C6C2C5A|nr:metallothionein [Cyanobium sp. ARS6]